MTTEMAAKTGNDKFTTGTQDVVGAQEKVGARDDGNWGPCDIVKKAFEYYKCHACLFSLIQLTIVLPGTLIGLLNQHYVRILIHTFFPVPPVNPCEDPCPSPPPSDGPSPDEWKCWGAFVVLLLLGFVYVINVIGSLYYAVGSIYAGKRICFKDVVKQLPCLWNGLAITGFCAYVLAFIVAVTVFLLGSVLHTFSTVSFLPPPVACFLTFTFAATVFFYVGTTIHIANGVTVFEQTFGLPAFCRALKLLKCKWCVAFGLALVFIIPQAILTVIIHAATWAWTGNCAKWVLFGVLAILLSWVVELSVVSSALFYLSVKQSKQEAISVDHFSFPQLEGGYELIASPEQVV